jgi:hypothetical protein
MVKLDKAFKIKNFLDNKEIKIIENIVKKIPKQIPTYNHDAYTNGFDYKFIKKFIDKKLKKIFNFFNIKDCVFLEEFVPWDIHTDYDKGDSTLLHTSDNFIKNGMKCKRALVLFLNQDTKENNG